ncbi:hypothetical protein [Streptomyces sp. NPDC096132]|uniref:hypothetical protein n=1 Tax=Streptomyces sp. NPDC096132 TaxID=3366075 RepID=UPI003808A2FF
MTHANHPVDPSRSGAPAHPPDTRPGGTYEAPSLLPAPGQERTYALLIAGIPLLPALVIMLIALLPVLASGSTGARAAESTYGFVSSAPLPPTVGDGPSEIGDHDDGGDPSVSGDPSDSGVPSESSGSVGPSDSDSPTGGDMPSDPGDIVVSYYSAINGRDFALAWELGGKNLEDDYEAFVAGFGDTVRDEITVNSVQGDIVSVDLEALLSDGTRQSYTGVYTVVSGVIVDARIRATD